MIDLGVAQWSTPRPQSRRLAAPPCAAPDRALGLFDLETACAGHMSWRYRSGAPQARFEAADKARELYHLLSSSHSTIGAAGRPVLHPDDYVAAYATGYEHERIQAELANRYPRSASPIRSSYADVYDARESERSVLSLLAVAREREEALHVYAYALGPPDNVTKFSEGLKPSRVCSAQVPETCGAATGRQQRARGKVGRSDSSTRRGSSGTGTNER
jgi:hypothetical protein